jgi:uracil-DNA glycosylase
MNSNRRPPGRDGPEPQFGARAPSVDALLREIRACTVCAADLPAGPRPIVQFSDTARLVIIGQAPGARVHASGIGWDDASGARLRDWTGLAPGIFYDPARVALIPMGLCYPGARAGGDLPPRPECAPLWHARIMARLPANRLTLLVGGYAQRAYLAGRATRSLTQTVRGFGAHGPGYFPLPHPSWRSAIWMRGNPWFERDVLPLLRARVGEAVGATGVADDPAG